MSASGCYCHINPPCSYCTELFECPGCGALTHPDDAEPINGVDHCVDCLDKHEDLSLEAPSGK